MANYELTVMVVPSICGVTADGRAPHHRDCRTGENSWHTHLGVHNVVLRLNGVELHMEVDNSEGRELTVYFGPVPKYDSSRHPGAEITSSSVRYEVGLKNSKGKEIKKAITENNVLAVKGLEPGTYYTNYRIRMFKPHAPDPHATPKPKLRVTG